MNDLLPRIEPLLAFAREALRNAQPDVARRAVAACRVYLRLFAPARYASYNPAHVLREAAATLEDETHTLDVEPVSDCTGAPEQMLDCLRQWVRSVELDGDSVLTVELFEQDALPCIALSFDGPGRFPRNFLIDGFLPLTSEELGQRWTLATRGGRVDPLPNGLLLRLRGNRVPPEPATQLESILREVEAALAAPSLELDAVERCLALTEGPAARPEPVALKAVIAEAMADLDLLFEAGSISVETMIDPSLPPLLLQRGCVRALFTNAGRYAAALLPNTGALSLLAEYDAPNRAAAVIITIQGALAADFETYHLASLRRGVVELHDGRFEVSRERDAVSLVLTFPDRIGRTLDAWLPGFDAFSAQSQQILRLLKSGGQTPPEDFLLAGVLETELERRLMPRLATPAVANCAHDATGDNRDLPGYSAPRLEKALGQIKRGKPRKEIASPPYAAEILWAFHRTPRQRAALGIQDIEDGPLRDLCLALLQTPPDALAALRLLVRTIP